MQFKLSCVVKACLFYFQNFFQIPEAKSDLDVSYRNVILCCKLSVSSCHESVKVTKKNFVSSSFEIAMWQWSYAKWKVVSFCP